MITSLYIFLNLGAYLFTCTCRAVTHHIRYMTWKTFSKEFHSCSTQTPVDSCAERRRSSTRADADSAQTDKDLPCGFKLRMAETRRRT